jgi:hypothetical protein
VTHDFCAKNAKNKFRATLEQSRKCAQTVPEAIGIAIGEKTFNRAVGTLPDGNGLYEQSSPLWRQRHQTGAAVGRVRRNFDQSAALQWREGRRQSGSIHCE